MQKKTSFYKFLWQQFPIHVGVQAKLRCYFYFILFYVTLILFYFYGSGCHMCPRWCKTMIITVLYFIIRVVEPKNDTSRKCYLIQAK